MAVMAKANRIRVFGRDARGEGKVALIIAILVIVGAVYLVKLMVPPRVRNADLGEFAENRIRSFVINQINREQAMQLILDESQKMGIPLTEEQVDITEGESRVKVHIEYDVTQKIVGGKEWTQHFVIDREVPRI